MPNRKDVMMISNFGNPGIITKQYPEYTLIVGKKSEDIFDYFGVDKLHGLLRDECYDNYKDAYIAGLCNVYPDDHSKYFIFINSTRLGNGYNDALLIMHESMHMSLNIHGSDLTYRNGIDLEEIAITWAEENTKSIYKFITNK